jgi:hypothetical protein
MAHLLRTLAGRAAVLVQNAYLFAAAGGGGVGGML